MLDGQQAAIHWDHHDGFLEEFVQVGLSRCVFVTDTPIITASGGAATADLMLFLIGQRHGKDLATKVADQMVCSAVRDAGEAQRVPLQIRHDIRNPHLARAIQLMNESIGIPLPPSVIAREIGIST